MRVLLIGSVPRRFGTQNFRWFAYTACALRRLGHTVIPSADRESWASSRAVGRRLAGVRGASRVVAGYEQARRRRRDRQLVALARRTRPDLVLVLKGDTLPEEVLAQVKRLARGPLVTWWVDDPWRSPGFLGSFALFDHVFAFDRSYLPRLAALGARQVHFLPCACDETVYRPRRLRAWQRRRFGCDVAFVAWYFPERGPIIRALIDGGLKVGIWGGDWDRPEARRVLNGAGVLRGPAVNDRVAATIYNASAMGLNVHQEQSRLGGLNTRTFELLASGVFELVDRVGGIEEFLEPGDEVVCYGSPEDACRLARWYLHEPGERARIAARGRARVLEEHTYVRRMQTLCALARG
ncbi:MAG: glycosyltransferase [Candidatus Omnitrophica bacterium]|nr:glycosyltransferase [Candidatus Omnitrophota bacterium]